MKIIQGGLIVFLILGCGESLEMSPKIEGGAYGVFPDIVCPSLENDGCLPGSGDLRIGADAHTHFIKYKIVLSSFGLVSPNFVTLGER